MQVSGDGSTGHWTAVKLNVQCATCCLYKLVHSEITGTYALENVVTPFAGSQQT